ncbi:hypothetical protein [Burkholderia cepacia]|uniref:hypothetical protein n=1 Tax=Burkholderia cepacia TaxID=292 RepID=UPI002AB7B003|nr:hypothetical protein [Burkholderia cepacia]
MNEKEAVALAAIHGITVSNERKSAVGTWFKVGAIAVTRFKGARYWNIDGGCVTYPRGRAIAIAIERILSARADVGRLDEAVAIATRAADAAGLPQTVFRTPDTCGWANTNSLAGLLSKKGCETFVTMLPSRFFL